MDEKLALWKEWLAALAGVCISAYLLCDKVGVLMLKIVRWIKKIKKEFLK